MEFLSKQIEGECDLSLLELVNRVNDRYKVSVSTKTMSRMLVREGLGLKKNASMRPSEIHKESGS
jgi:transposase